MELVIFSLKNVCRMLHIEYSCRHQDLISDLRNYCLFISDNAEKISGVLEDHSLKDTYNLLRDCPGNNQDEIVKVLAGLNELFE